MKPIFSGLLMTCLLVLTGGAMIGRAQQTALPSAVTSPLSGTQAEDIRDIIGPLPLADSSRFLLPLAAAAIVLSLAILFFFLLKRRRKPKESPVPPDVIALTDLDQARLLMPQPLLYAERISTILRRYIESRFRIRSTRQTTREFFSELHLGTTIAEVDVKIHAAALRECLEQCDIAKFAHGSPNTEGMERMDQAIRTFIAATRQRPPLQS